MKINTSHLVGAAIALAAVFFSKLDAQDAPAKAEPQKWEYAFLQSEIVSNTVYHEILTHDGEKRFASSNPKSPYPYGMKMSFNDFAKEHTALTDIQKMGNAGWELIETVYKGGEYSQTWYYFKRPKL